MKGGGDRKRKGGPIELDWDKLLLEDNDPPPEVVIEADAPIFGVEDESNKDPLLQNMSDRDLAGQIERLERLLQSSGDKLSDGGEKLEARLKILMGERAWRKHPKADVKCKKVTLTLLPDISSCSDVTDDTASHGVPPLQSEFATHLCSKLDKKKSSKSFNEELASLHHCDFKRENGPFMSPKTQKIGLSSRQAPFKSPNLLLVHTNEHPQPNCEQSQSESSSPTTRQSDKYSLDQLEKKEFAPRVQPMRNSKRNNRRTFVLVDEEEEKVEVDAENQSDQVGQSCKEMTIYYPSRDDPEAVEICYTDLECLAPESYLSSPIMNFYIRYLQKPTSPRTRKRCDYHFFNTYFYKKLKQDVMNKSDMETSFVKFRRWWKGVNIFEKAYIFLPIHENLHWSLIIICIPNKEDETGPIILHLDSLGLHYSKSILNDVKRFLIEEWKFLRQEDVLPELPIPDNIWDKLSRRIDEKVLEVPQQKNEYDCGLFVLFFMERFIEEAPERLKKKDLYMFGKEWFRPEEASSLRRRISNLLSQEFKNETGDTCILD